MAVRGGSAEWRGDLKGGAGEFALGNAGISAPYTFKSRFEDDQPGSNPEELIGAAQAACYEMQLAAILGDAGTHANSISELERRSLFCSNRQRAVDHEDLDRGDG